jgi:integrase
VETVPTLIEATTAFCRRDAFEPATAASYRKTLEALLAEVGNVGVDQINSDQLETLLHGRWGAAAPTTFNRHRAALLSFFGWTVERAWRADNPVSRVEARKLRRRSEALRRERPIPRNQLDELWALDGVAGRDRLLWRMAYETWCRANELLGLDLDDLDLPKREGVVTGKGGDRELVWWSTGSARLLPRAIGSRSTGPLFLTSRRPARPMPLPDTDRASGRVRLSYRRAEEIFAAAGARIDPEGVWTLHRLRHTGISHAVEQGWNMAQIRGKSRHSSMRSLAGYSNPSAANLAAMTAALDVERRTRVDR